MRKSLVVYLLLMIGIAGTCTAFTVFGSRQKIVRYHQHLEEPDEEALGVCSICGGESELCTHLPLISIDTGGKKIPGRVITSPEGVETGYETSDHGEEEIAVQVKIFDKKGQWHHLTDQEDQNLSAMFRVRGNTSRYFAKSNYKMTLVDSGDPQVEVKEKLLGMDAGSEWALHGPYLDKTLMRNYVCMNLSAEIMGDSPDVRFCELVVDGKYRGVYVLMEMIHEGEGRVDLTDYEEGDAVFSYMVRIEPQKAFLENPKKLDTFTRYTERMELGSQMELIYPGTAYQTEQVREYVETDMNEIERRLYSNEMEKDPDSCWKYLDLQSFADYYILQEYLAVNDAFYASTYFYKDVRGKLHVGPVWDYNNALDNFLRQMPEAEFLISQRGWYSQIMKSKRFVNYVVERYKNLRKGVLAQENLENYVRETEKWLGSAVDRNFRVWGYTFDVDQLMNFERQRPAYGDDAPLQKLNPGSYEEAVEWMLDYAEVRGRWLDRQMDTLHQYCHPSRKTGIEGD